MSRGHNDAKNRAKQLLDEAKRVTGSTPDSLVPEALNRVRKILLYVVRFDECVRHIVE